MKDFKKVKEILLKRANGEGLFEESCLAGIENAAQYLDAITRDWRQSLSSGLVDDELLLENFEEEELKAANIYAGGKHVVESAVAYVCGEADIEARGSSKVEACGVATIEARDNSVVKAYDYVVVKAYNSAMIEISGEVEAEAYDTVAVDIYGSARVKAYDSVTVEASGFSTVEVYNTLVAVKAIGLADVENYN